MTERHKTHLAEWIGVQVSATLKIDAYCQMEAAMVNGWLQLDLRGECGDARLLITPDALGHLLDVLGPPHHGLASAGKPATGDRPDTTTEAEQ